MNIHKYALPIRIYDIYIYSYPPWVGSLVLVFFPLFVVLMILILVGRDGTHPLHGRKKTTTRASNGDDQLIPSPLALLPFLLSELIDLSIFRFIFPFSLCFSPFSFLFRLSSKRNKKREKLKKKKYYTQESTIALFSPFSFSSPFGRRHRRLYLHPFLFSSLLKPKGDSPFYIVFLLDLGFNVLSHYLYKNYKQQMNMTEKSASFCRSSRLLFFKR